MAAFLLEAGAPLAIFGAQALHFVSPFIGHSIPAQADSLADLLEDREESLAFVAFLREAENL